MSSNKLKNFKIAVAATTTVLGLKNPLANKTQNMENSNLGDLTYISNFFFAFAKSIQDTEQLANALGLRKTVRECRLCKQFIKGEYYDEFLTQANKHDNRNMELIINGLNECRSRVYKLTEKLSSEIISKTDKIKEIIAYTDNVSKHTPKDKNDYEYNPATASRTYDPILKPTNGYNPFNK